MLSFEATFPLDTVSAETVAEILLELLPDRASDPARSGLLRMARARRHFELEVGTWSHEWGEVRNGDHALLWLDGAPPQLAENMMLAVAHLSPLILGRFYDREYDHWQNAEDPLEFKAGGRSMDGLPLRSNGLPPPLDQMVVDTSGNPGRRVFGDRYVEAVGHRMWLGPAFFERVPGADRESILRAPSVEVRELADGILELQAHPEPFIDESTAEVQRALRTLIFPTSAQE